MSYLFDASTERLNGTFSTARTEPITIFVWIKKQDWSGGSEGIIQLSQDSLDRSPSIGMQLSSTVDAFQGFARDTSDTGSFMTEGVTTDSANATWWPIWMTVTSDTSRALYETDSTQVDTDVTSIDIGTALDEIMIGNRNTGSNGHASGNVCYIAEVCIWDKVLSSSEMDQLCPGGAGSEAGPVPSTIASANVIGYWTLRNDGNGLTNQGSDTGGDLTATGATANSDHPNVGGVIQRITRRQYTAYSKGGYPPGW